MLKPVTEPLDLGQPKRKRFKPAKVEHTAKRVIINKKATGDTLVIKLKAE